VTDYLIAAHRSVEQGHRIMHQRLGKEPLLDLGMRLGEGTGAALAMNLIEAAQRILTEVATFDEAHVSKREKRIQGSGRRRVQIGDCKLQIEDCKLRIAN